MNQNAYNRIRDIVYTNSGIKIKDGKMSMVASRIAKRLKSLELESELAYVKHLEESLDTELVHLLDAISTNVTSFFRESHHFEVLEKQLNKWIKDGQRRFRFWSSASSTGEEPYTLMMTAMEVFNKHGIKPDFKILATDISTRVLQEGMEGSYSAERVKGIPPRLLKEYLRHTDGPDGGYHTFKPEYKKHVVFRRLNLSKPPFPMKGPMDTIFCRNVMIYFDQPVRDRLIKEFHRLLRDDSFLFVGHAESLTNNSDLFQRHDSSIYAKAA